MTVITGPILDSFGQPANGYLYGEQTAPQEDNGAYVAPVRVKARILNGGLFLDDGVTPLEAPPTPSGEALIIVEDFRNFDKQITRAVIVPDVASVAYADLQSAVNPVGTTMWIVPGWLRDVSGLGDEINAAKNTAVAAAELATGVVEGLPGTAAAAVSAGVAAADIPGKVDAKVAGLELLQTGTYDDANRSFVMTDDTGKELWPEADLQGNPTQRVADLVGAKMTIVPSVPVDDYPRTAWTSEDGVILAEFDDVDGKLSFRSGREWRERIIPAGDDITPAAVSTTLLNMMAQISNNSVKYTLGTWYPATYGSQSDAPYLELPLPGDSESTVRPTAEAAHGLAELLASGYYSEAITQKSEAAARATLARMTSSLAYRHKANGGNWGGGPAPWENSSVSKSWQAAMWAYLAAAAAWLTWTDLPALEQGRVLAMVEWEANRFLRWQVPYYKDGSTPIVQGNTRMEETAWNAHLVALAMQMLPAHANSDAWMVKLTEMLIAAPTRPSDTFSGKVLHGIPVADLLQGRSNINEDGTVINHGVVHPDYMSAIADLWQCGLIFARAGKPIPRAAVQNGPLVYSAMTDLLVTAPHTTPLPASPAGTIYTPGSYAVYYPGGADWGSARVVQFACLDVMAHRLGMDTRSTIKAATWAQLHLQQCIDQQARSTTGQMYQPSDANTSASVEQWSSHLIGKALLAALTTVKRTTNAPPLTIAMQNRGL